MFTQKPPLPKPFFVRAIHDFELPAPAYLENILSFDRGELGLVNHVETSGWADCSLLKSGSRGWLPLNYGAMYGPMPMKPLLKAVIDFTEALRLGSEVHMINHGGEGIVAITKGVSDVIVSHVQYWACNMLLTQGAKNLGYALDNDCPQIGVWKVLHPIRISIHHHILLLQKHLGTTQKPASRQLKQENIHTAELVAATWGVVVRADAFLTSVRELQKSQACSNSKSATPLQIREQASSSTIRTVDVTEREPGTPSTTTDNKQEHVAQQAIASFHGFPEHRALTQAEGKAENHQLLVNHRYNMELQSSRDQAFFPHQSLIGRAQITRCSLPALIRYLTDCELKSIREPFVSTFFVTCELFCTSEELLSALTEQFKAAQFADVSKRQRIQFRVCYALRVWLGSYWSPNTDQRILLSLDSFLRCEASKILPMSSAFLLQIVSRLNTPQHSETSNSPSPPTTKGKNPCRHGSKITFAMTENFFACRRDQLSIIHISHNYLACQITSKQMQVFCAIQPRETLAGRRMAHGSKDAPNVAAMTELTNGISNWVKESVLTNVDPNTRGFIIERWILIAQHLFQVKSF
jgi:hypothetical protein